MGTSSWWDLFLRAKLHNLVASMSDHSPILLTTEHEIHELPKRFFRFEYRWFKEPDLDSVVKAG